jgi:hypothetical protein
MLPLPRSLERVHRSKAELLDTWVRVIPSTTKESGPRALDVRIAEPAGSVQLFARPTHMKASDDKL